MREQLEATRSRLALAESRLTTVTESHSDTLKKLETAKAFLAGLERGGSTDGTGNSPRRSSLNRGGMDGDAATRCVLGWCLGVARYWSGHYACNIGGNAYCGLMSQGERGSSFVMQCADAMSTPNAHSVYNDILRLMPDHSVITVFCLAGYRHLPAATLLWVCHPL